MTSRERFEVWIADKHATPLFKSYAWAGWQAAERDALERAAQEITRGIDGVKQNGWTGCANERLRCADAIRALIEQDNKETK